MAFGLPQQNAGKLDRRVKLFRASVVINDLYEPEEKLSHYATVWAHVKHETVKEVDEAFSARAVKFTNLTIRWRTDLDEKDWVEHDNDMYKVTGIIELGRREMARLHLEYVEGNAYEII